MIIQVIPSDSARLGPTNRYGARRTRGSRISIAAPSAEEPAYDDQAIRGHRQVRLLSPERGVAFKFNIHLGPFEGAGVEAYYKAA